jgi:hypothetical protein
MADYIVDPLNAEAADVDTLQQDAFDFLQTKWPNWSPSEGNLVTWVVAAMARMVMEARDVATDVPPAIFKYLGSNIVGIPPVPAQPATVHATITLVDNPAGRTIEAGTLFGIEDGNGDIFPFEVVTDVVVPATVLATGTGAVELIAVDEGAQTSQLGGVGVSAINSESISWISTVVLTAITSGGTDEEDDDDYLARLSELMTLPPTPVLPSHYATLARSVAALHGIQARVLALDGYNPADSTFNNEKMVTIAGFDVATGSNLPTEVKNDIAAEVAARREWNFVVNVIDPTRTAIDVTVVGVSVPGSDPAVVDANVTAALTGWLTGTNWGASTEGNEWLNEDKVRHQDASAIVNNIAGFDYWTTLTTGINGGAQSTTDKTLTGPAALPTPGAIAVTIT